MTMVDRCIAALKRLETEEDTPREQVLAVLRTLRDPTDEMVLAAAPKIDDYAELDGDDRDRGPEWAFHKAYQAAIDKALE